MTKRFVLSFALLVGISCLFAQKNRDKGVFVQYENKYWKHIAAELKKFENPKKEQKKRFRVDLSQRDFPTSREKYATLWHNPTISQGNTGTCWDFSTTSFFESEIYRIHGKKVKLSEMYTMYWETVEKSRRFVRQRGNSLFDEGSEGNAVVRIWQKYGIVPEDAYPAIKPGQPFHDHEAMYGEMKKYLASVKRDNAWNEAQVVATIESILQHYLGKPPEFVLVNSEKITPKEYLASLKLEFSDYLDLISLTQQPYYQKVEYEVPDNWWHSKKYLNVPLDDFIWVLRNSLRNGYSICLGGDVSEPGYDAWKEVAIVPSFDIPSEYIDEHARQFRFSNQSTTDDHGIHCVGWLEKDGENWYLIKDSASGSRNGPNFGYLFYSEDYIKLKMMNIMVHKDAAMPIYKKFQNMQK